MSSDSGTAARAVQGLSGLELLRAMIAGELPGGADRPSTIGFRLVEVERGPGGVRGRHRGRICSIRSAPSMAASR